MLLLGVSGKSGGVVYDSEAQTYFTTVTSRGGSVSPTRKQKINDFIVYLRDLCPAGNQWQYLERAWVLHNTTEVAALTSVVNPTSTIAQAINSPTFTVDDGYAFNGTSQYINTKFNPSTDATQFLYDSHSAGVVWQQTGLAIDVPLEIAIGGDDGVNQFFLAPDNQNYGTIFNPSRAVAQGFGMGNTGVTSGTNTFMESRDGLGVLRYQNNAGFTTNNGTTGGGDVTVELYIGGFNQAGSPNYYWNRKGNRQQMKFVFLGGKDIQLDWVDFAVRTYLL